MLKELLLSCSNNLISLAEEIEQRLSSNADFRHNDPDLDKAISVLVQRLRHDAMMAWAAQRLLGRETISRNLLSELMRDLEADRRGEGSPGDGPRQEQRLCQDSADEVVALPVSPNANAKTPLALRDAPGAHPASASSKPRLRRREASDYLKTVHGIQVAPSTLAKLATLGGGPAMQYVSRFPLYPISELDAWAAGKLGSTVQNTSEKHVKGNSKKPETKRRL
jgi:hypothetical protein